MVRSFMQADTAEPGPWIRKVPPCRIVRGSSSVCAQAAYVKNIVSSQRTLTA
jgi:hypothetical protein